MATIEPSIYRYGVKSKVARADFTSTEKDNLRCMDGNILEKLKRDTRTQSPKK